MKEMAYAAAELAHRFGGVMSGEHGDGLQRSELNEIDLRPRALPGDAASSRRIFDPRGLMNPGKKVDAPPMTENLRYGPAYQPRRDQDPPRLLAAKAASCGAVEMCNGAAVCRKLKAGTMCPSYMATKDETGHHPRPGQRAPQRAGRAHLRRRTDFTSKETYEVMDLCLSCKACKTECPSSVDMAKLKTEFLAHYHDAARHAAAGARLRAHPHAFEARRAPVAPLANLAHAHAAGPAGDARCSASTPTASSRRSQRSTFVTRWKQHEKHAAGTAPDARQGRLFPRHLHDLQLPARSAWRRCKLLEAAGFDVIIEERRACCGRPMLSKGLVDDARKVGAPQCRAARAVCQRRASRSSAPSRAAS